MGEPQDGRAAVSLALLVALILATVLGSGVAVARSAPSLIATDASTAVTGTEASAVFTLGERTIRQVRYADRGTLRYTFEVRNDGRLPVTVEGLADDQPPARLFRYVGLVGADGAREVRVGAGESAKLTLAIAMGGCETLSSRAGSFAGAVVVRARQAGMFTDEVTVRLPEEIHTGSPREAFCPNASATSRPNG